MCTEFSRCRYQWLEIGIFAEEFEATEHQIRCRLEQGELLNLDVLIPVQRLTRLEVAK
jgi:hypothetical protein